VGFWAKICAAVIAVTRAMVEGRVTIISFEDRTKTPQEPVDIGTQAGADPAPRGGA
jgi:hypothetical protein